MQDWRHRRELVSIVDARRVSAAEILGDVGGSVRVARHRVAALCGTAIRGDGLGSAHPALAAGVRAHRRAQYRAVSTALVGARTRGLDRSALPKFGHGAVRDGNDLVE